jgi:hypothetical protein
MCKGVKAILIIYLKRFKMDVKTSFSRVNYPFELEIKTKIDTYIVYKLSSVICHTGKTISFY